jgi:hypothetical protein
VTKLLLAALLREARRLKHAATLSAIDKADGSESSQDATGVIPELRTERAFRFAISSTHLERPIQQPPDATAIRCNPKV